MAKKKKEIEIKENYNDYIIAIDASTTDSGVAVYSLSSGEIVYTGHCNTESVRKLKKYRGYNVNAVKLNIQKEFFTEILRKFPPSIVIFERGFAKFRKEVEALNQANGVLYAIFWNYTQIKYPPTTVKAEICHGKASKEDVRDTLLLNLPELEGNKTFYENDNVSDAVAVLATHLLKTGVYKKSSWKRTVAPAKKERKVQRMVIQENNIY